MIQFLLGASASPGNYGGEVPTGPAEPPTTGPPTLNPNGTVMPVNTTNPGPGKVSSGCEHTCEHTWRRVAACWLHPVLGWQH